MHVLRTSLDVQPAAALAGSGPSWTPAESRTAFAWTPDGRALVFVGSKAEAQQLYVRALDRDGARPLAGTEGDDMPVVSPDGQWVAFWVGGSIRKVPLTGGPVEVLEADAGIARAPSRLVWDAAGNILHGGPYRPIRQLGATGASDLTRLAEGELSHGLPSLLPAIRSTGMRPE